MKPPISLVVDLSGGFGTSNIRTQYFFRERADAKEAFETLRLASSAYHSRANDRERIISFCHLAGEAAVDVSLIAAIGFADELGEGRDALEAWENAIAEVKGTAEGIRKAKAGADDAARLPEAAK